jgi:hypothetical protein
MLTADVPSARLHEARRLQTDAATSPGFPSPTEILRWR